MIGSERAAKARRQLGAVAALVMGLVVLSTQPAAAAVPPTLGVSTWRAEMGAVPLGGASVPTVITVTNLGPGTATGLTVGTVDQPDFSRTTTCGSSLPAGQTCTVSVVLHGNDDPAHPGEPAYAVRRGHVRISAAGGSAPLVELEGSVSVSGATGGSLLVNPRFVDLGRVPVGSVTPTIQVTITSTDAQSLDRIDLVPSDSRFEVVSNGCAPVIPSGGTCTIGIRYRPTAAGTPTGRIGLEGMRGTRHLDSSTVEVRGGGPLTVSEAFAHRMYQVFFNRPPSWSQVRLLADEMEDGARSKRSVVHDFLWADPWLTFQVTNLLLMDSRIGSDAAAELAKPYVEAIQNGSRTLASVEIELASRSGVVEYRGAAQGLAGWVDFMYGAYLGRAPDPTGREFWTARAERLGPASVARSFYNDPWSLRRRVNLRYQEALGRPADPAGIAYWSPRLAKRGDQNLGESLAISAEFLRRANTYPFDEAIEYNPD